MPSNLDIDKQNDNSQKKSEAEKKFKIIKKRILWCGIICLLTSISVYAIAYFFYPIDSLTIRLIIFISLVLAIMSIWFYSATGIDNNRPQFVSSSIAIFGLFFALTFYPNQEFQEKLKIFIVVVLFSTFFFFLLLIFIHATFFSSKNPDIRQSVDFVSNHFAVEVLFSTLILGTLFGTIAFLVFLPDKDNSTFFGGIDIKNVALATAGLVTFFWAAKATKNKSIELEEKKQDGKRHDNEIAMAKRRDTAQLIAEASKLLSSESDAQKYAGLSFLNAVASDPRGPLRKEAFDLITDFIFTANSVTIANKPRMRAIYYADDLVGNNPDNFEINEFIQISSLHNRKDILKSIEIKNLYVVYIGFIIVLSLFQKENKLKRAYQFAFIECIFDGAKGYFFNRRSRSAMVNAEGANTLELTNIAVWNCEINFCKIGQLNVSRFVQIEESSTNKVRILNYVPDKYRSIDCPQVSTFLVCDFSDCPSWNLLFFSERNFGKKKIFENCYYHSGHEPNGFVEKEESGLLTKITSKKQFGEFFLTKYMQYYQQERNKGKNSRIPKNKWFCD